MVRHLKVRWLVVVGLTFSLSALGQAAGQDEENPIRDVGRGRVTEPEPPTPERPDALQVERLERRPGEIIGDDPQGRMIVMGMYLQEDSETGVPVVVEVAPGTPAFDAGIQAGDEIHSFDGLTAVDYRKWIDGIRKLVVDAPEGRSLPVEVLRDGEELSLRIRRPEATALPQPRQPPTQPPDQQPLDPQRPFGPQATLPVRQGDRLLSAGFFGGQFGDVLHGPSQRAIAEIVRLEATQQPDHAFPQFETPVQPPSAAAPQGQSPLEPGAVPSAGGRAAHAAEGAMPLGLAGFRDQEAGMLVMLDVGGLEPGTYMVGIDDISVVLQGLGSDVGQPGTPHGQRGQTPVEPPPATPHQQPGPLPEVPNSAPSPEGLRPPVERGQPGGEQSPEQAAGFSQPPEQAPSRQPTQQPGLPNDGLPGEPIGEQPAAPGLGGTAPAVGPTIPIGMLTVDQGGTGTLQQVVEGVQVQHVVGQAIVIYQSQGDARPDATHPPGQAAADPAGLAPNTGAVEEHFDTPRSPELPAPPPQQQQRQQQQQPGQRQPMAAPGQQQFLQGHSPQPLAGGVIRLISDGGRAAAREATTPSPTDRIDSEEVPRGQPEQPLR